MNRFDFFKMINKSAIAVIPKHLISTDLHYIKDKNKRNRRTITNNA